MPDIKLFSGSKSKYLAEKVADHYGYSLGDCEVKTFSDGEMQVVINESVRGAYVFFISSTSVSYTHLTLPTTPYV